MPRIELLCQDLSVETEDSLAYKARDSPPCPKFETSIGLLVKI